MNSHPPLLFRLLAAAATAGLLAAQDAPAPAAAPHIVIDTVGPDGWRQRLGPTNLGGLLESEQGRQLWQPGVAPLLTAWQRLVGNDETFTAARARLLGYGGRIQLACWLNEGTLRQQQLVSAVLLLGGDGRVDMPTLAADLRQLQGSLPGEWQKLVHHGTTYDVLAHGDDRMTAPIVDGNQLLVFLGTAERLPEALIAGKALAAQPPRAAARNVPALRLRVDVPEMLALAKASSNAEEIAVSSALGLDGLGPLTFTVDAAGPSVQLELAQDFRAAPSGLFAALCPASAAVPEVLRLVPPDTMSWKVGHFDFGALYGAVLAAICASGTSTLDELRAEIRESVGLDPAADLFAHLGDEMMFLGSPLRGLDRPSEFTWVMAVRLRDQKKFRAGLATALGKARPFLQREHTVKVGTAELHRYGSMAGYDVWLATGQDLFALAGGRDAEEELTALLQRAASPAPADSGPPPPPIAFAPLQRHLPAGLNGLASGDLDSLVAMPIEWWLLAVDGLLPFRSPAGAEPPDPEQQAAVRALLQQHNLATLRTATGRAEQSWRWRLFW